MKCVRRVYLSCYSCPHSTILTNGKQKMVQCGLNGKTFQLKKGMSYPDFCEISATNHKTK